MKRLITGVLRVFVIVIMTMLPFTIKAQSMDPEIQQMTDELLKWTQQQFEKNGSVDQHKLDSMNTRIRLKQDEITARKMQAPSVADSAKGEKLITVELTQGGMLTVPEGKIWKVKQATCSSGMGEYKILVGSVKFKEEYGPGEKIIMPAYTPEASLLTEDFSSIIYSFNIIERSIK
ncbi:MAG: hypothetical protein WCM76_13385 [Bacteroidota bacterium]